MQDRTSIEDTVLDAINAKVPLALILGQAAWQDEKGRDPILDTALQRLNRTSGAGAAWSGLIENGHDGLPQDFYEWLAERFSRRANPDWMSGVARLPWSAVFTSSLDPTLRNAFASEQRDPQVILTSREHPPAIRSRGRTPMYYLFGRAGLSDPYSMPPKNRAELRGRRVAHAVPILNRIPATITAFGLCVIDGLDSKTDWLPLDALLSAIEQLPEGRAVWCGFPYHSGDVPEDIQELINVGKLRVTRTRLSQLVAGLEVTGRLSDVLGFLSDNPGVVTLKTAQNSTFTPSPDLRIRVEAVASIVDDEWLAFEQPYGADARYTAFREFHGDTLGPRALVAGIGSGFAIERDFEEALWSLVDRAIDDHAKYQDPIILHGQSASGKSVALARAVRKVREAGRAAVLYSSTRIPSAVDIEAFCEAAEESGAAVTAIICDCNAPPFRYRDLLGALRSRGRRVVILGSSYKETDIPSESARFFVEAPEHLSQRERDMLADLLSAYALETKPSAIADTSSVLATLYRLLPASRARISAGLGQEARSMEQLIRMRGGAKQRVIARTLFAEKLIAAGLVDSELAVLSDQLNNALSSADDRAARLIDLVMVPGRLGCFVPVDLLLRAVTEGQSVDISGVARLFRGLDIFRWRGSGEEGEGLFVSARLTLEAELICRRRTIDARHEGDYLVSLVKAARLNWDSTGSERAFLLDLIHRLGPDGPMKNRYRESYLSVARALTDLREQFGIEDPSLMLQESALRREAIKEGQTLDEQKLAILEEARAAVQVALEQMESVSSRGARRTRSNLAVERASIYGFLARDRAQKLSSADDIWSAYQAARAAARIAVGLSDDYFPIDVSLWIPLDILTIGGLTRTQEYELVADIHAVLDLVDPSALPAEQRERFNKRKYNLGEVLGEYKLSEEAFAALSADGSTAGFYLRAKSLAPIVWSASGEELGSEDIRSARTASEFLRRNWPSIETDERCLRFLLQCEWAVSNRHALFRGDRAPVPYSDDDRRKLLNLVRLVNEVSGPAADNRFRYLEAVLSWINNEDARARDIWRELRSDTDYVDPGRVVRRHLLTDENGRPVSFSGRIESESGSERVNVRVDGLNRQIQLLTRDFSDLDLSYGRTVPAFGIAFNYIGAIADPIVKRSSH